MTINSISAGGLSQAVLYSSDSVEQQAVQALQTSLTLGDLNTAQSAFQSLQNILQNSSTSNGTTAAGNSQLTQDLATLGNALQSGDVNTAQSAFTTVLGDLKGTASAAQINEATAASQSVELVQQLLSTLDETTPSTTLDQTTSILQDVYGSQSGLDVLA
jgi:ribosomal protein S20